MPLEFRFCPVFRSRFEDVIASYPKSQEDITSSILTLQNHISGDTYPGFSDYTVKKIRIGLKKYRISKRDGLRFIYLCLKEKELIIPLHIYKKNQYKREQHVKNTLLEILPQILDELELNICSKQL